MQPIQNQKNQKTEQVLDLVWLIVMIGTACVAIYKHIQTNFSQSILLYFATILAACVYFSRRYLRKVRFKSKLQK